MNETAPIQYRRKQYGAERGYAGLPPPPAFPGAGFAAGSGFTASGAFASATTREGFSLLGWSALLGGTTRGVEVTPAGW